MDATRSSAYGRILRAVEAAYPGALTFDEQQCLRYCADELLFSVDRDEAAVRFALDQVIVILIRLRDTSEEDELWIDQLADDLEAVGPPARANTDAGRGGASSSSRLWWVGR